MMHFLKAKKGEKIMQKQVFNLSKVKELPSPLGKVARSAGRANFEGDLKPSEQLISPSLEFLSSLSFAKKFFSLPRRDRRTAFTLAEVLITLGVVGVIAAMTLPILIKKYDEMVTVNRVKQAYSIFSQAYLRAQEANDSILYWDIGQESTQDGAKKLYNYFKPYLYKVKDCDNVKGGCFAQNYKALFSEQPYIYQPDKIATYAGGVLKNGVTFGFWSKGTGCNKSSYGDYNCGAIKFDINGKKGPNRAGKDYFNFTIYNTGIKGTYTPKSSAGGYGEYCQYNDPSRYNGVMCTGWIINNGNMDYLRRDVSGE